MGFLHCCGALRRSVSYTLVPESGYLLAEADVVEMCPVCGHYVVQITRIDCNHVVSTVRKSNLQARKLFENIKSSILFKQKYRYSPLKGGKSNSYLGYSEYGVKKRCYSNLSTLKIGLQDPFEGLWVTNPINTGSCANHHVCEKIIMSNKIAQK